MLDRSGFFDRVGVAGLGMAHHLIEDAGRLFAVCAAPCFCRGRHKHEWRRKSDQQHGRAFHRLISPKKNSNECKNRMILHKMHDQKIIKVTA
jgi:hypothetical protein